MSFIVKKNKNIVKMHTSKRATIDRQENLFSKKKKKNDLKTLVHLASHSTIHTFEFMCTTTTTTTIVK